ncbi:hypothetical protein BpHYR1_048366 [Brachionus plicatilis]|uniref:Uncharacterized protein n=1 Tax=Brachionus plicatilis TaxID=10195 RepID=A0A3M7PYI7_BRAPC|nr:hypothetical protein BpHYR1_048366 [Brachionus plicatilis]
MELIMQKQQQDQLHILINKIEKKPSFLKLLLKYKKYFFSKFISFLNNQTYFRNSIIQRLIK